MPIIFFLLAMTQKQFFGVILFVLHTSEGLGNFVLFCILTASQRRGRQNLMIKMQQGNRNNKRNKAGDSIML